MTDLSKFSVVEFTKEGKVEIVPSSWVNEDNLCQCPAKNKWTTEICNKIEKLEKPNSKWRQYPVKVWKQCVTFEAAGSILQVLLDNSELESDWNDAEATKDKETANPERTPDFQFDYLDQDKGSSSRQNNSKEVPHPSDRSVADQPQSSQAFLPSIDVNHLIADDNVFENGSSNREIVTNSHDVDFSEMREESKKFHKFVITKLISIEKDLQDLKKLQIIQQSTVSGDDSDDPPLPCDTQEDVDDLENWLQLDENRIKLILRFRLIGGKTAEQSIRLILGKLITPALARKFNYTGLNGKGEFKALTIKKLIIDSVRQNPSFSGLTDEQGKTVVINYFRNSKDLAGGREARRKVECSKKEKSLTRSCISSGSN